MVCLFTCHVPSAHPPISPAQPSPAASRPPATIVRSKELGVNREAGLVVMGDEEQGPSPGWARVDAG
ncbi:hypothetical protein IAQ61_002381 [Plenodomus lingam]|uniref:Predicted protein n=1 Tax=Leptosphaeria maculans (strain JN3 / isolate v23.1.3 / race Av1-4-5-6-7-8) TaxID=985895 RepID=E4ZHT0_LEPMJ|nr:predicted protein [Plenodomus lingam JN3]KAH9877020.1 hypothetical protein IAQ61_002381 [Plenodomus lingam]CBX90913.1 predicted protein [Plenodomus lingam JN3]